MTDERIARYVALGVLGLFSLFGVIAVLEPERPIPDPLYPVAIMAVGYLLGFRVMKNGNGGSK